MRILEVISGLGLGGAERALVRRLQFAPDDVETHILNTKVDRDDLASEASKFAVVHTETSPLRETAQLVQPDIIVTHNPREALRVLAHPRLSRQYPVTVIAHNAISSEFRAKAALLDLFLPQVNMRAAHHIAVSSSAAQGIQCRNARNVSTILLGGAFARDVNPRHDLWPTDTIHRLLVLGRFSPQKNLDGLILAIRQKRDELKASGTHIAIVGEGEMATGLRSLVSQLGVCDVTSIHGWIEPADSALAAAHTLVIASTHEGGPLTLYEALLAGLRVVSTPTGAAPEIAELYPDSGVYILNGASVQDLECGLEIALRLGPQREEDRQAQAQRFAFLECDQVAPAFYNLFRTLA